MQSTLGPTKQGTAGKAEASDKLCNGEAATLLLVGGLRESPLIPGGIGHGDAGAVDDFDVSTAPKLVRGYPSLEFVGGVLMDGEQLLPGEAGTGAAVGGGAGGGTGLSASDIPGLDLADRFAAGAVGGKDLRKEGPEGQTAGVGALAAVGATFGGLEQASRHPRRADLAELAQGGPFESLRLGLQLLASRALGSAEEQTVKPDKERRCIVHI